MMCDFKKNEVRRNFDEVLTLKMARDCAALGAGQDRALQLLRLDQLLLRCGFSRGQCPARARFAFHGLGGSAPEGILPRACGVYSPFQLA